MPVYEATFSRTDSTSHTLMLDLIGGGTQVLDVGCATGYLARALVERGCQVTGIEYVPEAAEQARPVLSHLVIGDVTTLDLDAELGESRFDYIVLGDILEHLPDPAAVLRSLVGLLAPGGSVVLSAPNVTHGALRLALLQGRWQYTDRGLLDRTHLRFFTRTSLLELLHEAGLTALEIHPSTTGDVVDTEIEVDLEALPPGIVDWVRAQPDALVYQWVLRAVVDDATGRAQSLAVEVEDLRNATAAMRAEIDQVRAELATVTAQAAQAVAARDAAWSDLATVRATKMWRASEAVRRGLGGSR